MKKILQALGITKRKSASTETLHNPYSSHETNFMYNLLFCDIPGLFHDSEDSTSKDWHRALFVDQEPSSINTIAADEEIESRIRLLAFNWLRKNNQSVPKAKLLGVVVEVPLDNGLDTLAAYLDGRVRYINQTEKMSIVEEGYPNLNSLAIDLVTQASPILAQIGPWDKDRLAPPEAGSIRLTFLASDGLYFGEGPFQALQQDPLAGPIVDKAMELLQTVVNESIEPRT